jgi:hypothetical protein
MNPKEIMLAEALRGMRGNRRGVAAGLAHALVRQYGATEAGTLADIIVAEVQHAARHGAATDIAPESPEPLPYTSFGVRPDMGVDMLRMEEDTDSEFLAYLILVGVAVVVLAGGVIGFHMLTGVLW